MSSSTERHDVFLSFRGEDTRNNFTSHLYHALSKKLIKTFIDYDIPRGADVWPLLSRTIEASRISVVIFSENYATSKWCLEELDKILECRKALSQVVIPVFYKTDPSDIRKQTGTYGAAFDKHEPGPGDKDSASNKLKVLRWRAALTEAANMSGWQCEIHTDETQLIEKIIKDILQKLDLRESKDLKGILIEKNCTNVESLMKENRVIGIWGRPGIGKTTIAKVLFAKLFPQYDNSCLVLNAKVNSLGKLHSELFKEEISSSNIVGPTFDMRRLRGKKVFIVLDNVDDLDQIEYLCQEYRDLSYDSRLIITTGDRHLFCERVEYIYEVKEWERPESLEFFCLKAFKQNHPRIGYEELSDRAVEYAGGVPLALKVLGSYLRSKSIEFWESTLTTLNDYPNKEIQDLLRVSYDEGLDGLQKKIFLDIAFFFDGEKKDHVTRILDACGFGAKKGIEDLEDKALITISNSKRIQMPNLQQKMGLEIVRIEDEKNPGRRSRLRGSEAREVIEKKKGTDAIEGITLDLSQIKDLRLPADTFTKMEALRFLKFYIPSGQSCSNTYLDLPTDLEPFSDKLRYVEWIGYPFESLPHHFSAKLLVEIHLLHSKVKQLWEGMQELDNLEGIDLSECKQLVELPDLSKASRLKWVNLSGCESLCYLHDSVLSADTLVTLILDRCTNLVSVKGKKHLKSLEMIGINGCLSLEEFAVSSDLMENLDLSYTGIQRLNISIGLLQNLKWLNLGGLRLTHLPNELACLTNLKELKLSNKELVIEEKQLNDLFDGLHSLQVLHLKECSNFFEVPDNIKGLSKLQELRLDGSNVTKLPASIKDLQELEILSLENCKELLCLPELPPLIKQLYAVNCTSLVSVSNLKTLATKMLGKAKHISFKNSLRLDGHSLKCIVESLHLTMVSAAFNNVIVRRLRVAIHSYNYTSVEFCLLGSSVPRQVNYTSEDTSITIELPDRSNLLGFIYTVVLSPTGGVKKHGTNIKCECPLAQGTKVTWLKIDITELKKDHVYVWYDPFHCDGILKYYEPKVTFDFFVANDTGEVDDSICIKECGVRLISVSEQHNVLPELELDSDKTMDLKKGLELDLKSRRGITLTSTERSDGIVELDSDSAVVEPDSAEEGNERKHRYSIVEDSFKSDAGRFRKENTSESTNAVKNEGNTGLSTEPNAILHEPAGLQSDKENESKEKSITEPKSAPVEEDSGSKDHFSDVEESIGSTHKETKTSAERGLKENTTEFTKFIKSKGKEVMHTKSDAGLHLPVVSDDQESASSFSEENVSKDKSSQNLLGGQSIVHFDTHDLIVGEKENEPMDVDKPESQDGSDEDPFAVLDSILLGMSEMSSAKATSSTNDVAIREALHNLERLLENPLESILGDLELQRQLRVSLQCIEQGSDEKVSPHVAKLVGSMTSSVDDLFSDFTSTQQVVQYHTTRLKQRKKLEQQGTDAKKRRDLVKKEMSKYKFETEGLDRKAKKLDEEIRILVEQRETVELEKTKLKEKLERCGSEKKKLEDDAWNWVRESKELKLEVEKSESSYAAALSKQKKLNERWEGFKTDFAELRNTGMTS